jgi:hypothetical protein
MIWKPWTSSSKESWTERPFRMVTACFSVRSVAMLAPRAMNNRRRVDPGSR